ncbi:molecular chaperone TorD family protein (plasmid) [Halobaculum sp. CBA1158]|uniref:TorD/DmsD family molecular chaperone n=1 Tax=Halobaculum sp. CBA1158 TaxID=2904243 RepID=UPI001F403C88|nr:molecular chaperone TorD family protein [Halobaculum sp. CBA1158]UIP01434.1 molecular chaperone TorD family protein [Halobaculum sp. CBA1158]
MTDNSTPPTDLEATRDPPADPTDPEEFEAIKRHHGSRAALYAVLAGTFCYPDGDAVAELTDEETISAMRSAANRLGCGDAAADLASALTAPDLDAETFADGYDALFGLPGDDGEYPVVPYEADYTARDDLSAKQRRIATVSGLLSAFDLERADDYHERRDHVAVELELMQVLAARRAIVEADSDDDRGEDLALAEATVLEEHLADFLPGLAHDIGSAAGREGVPEAAADVYVAAADLATALLERDRAGHPDAPTADATNGGEPA